MKTKHIPFSNLGVASLALILNFLGQGCNFFGSDDSEINQDPSVTPEVRKYVAGQVRKYQSQIETVRGLKFIRPVASSVISRQHYREMTAREIDSSLSDSLSQEISLELAQLGFFSDTSQQYKDLFKTFEGGFAVGFYSGGSDTVFVIAEYAHDDNNLLHILPHELTHALQDQYQRLQTPAFTDPILNPYRQDAVWYHNSLVEGEAFFVDALTTATYAFPQPDPRANALAVVEDIRAKAFSEWKQTQRPNNLFLPMHSLYQFGPAMIGHAFQAKGWDSVEALYNQPSRPSLSAVTSESIDWDPIAATSWIDNMDTTQAFVDIGSHGSMGLMALLIPILDSADFDHGLHWRGDRYVFCHPPQAKWGQLVWQGDFMDSVSANRAHFLLESLLRQRFLGSHYPEVSVSSDTLIQGLPGVRLQGMGLTTYLMQAGSSLFWVEGFSDSAAAKLVGQLKDQEIHAPWLTKQGQTTVLSEFQSFFRPGTGRIYRDLLLFKR